MLNFGEMMAGSALMSYLMGTNCNKQETDKYTTYLMKYEEMVKPYPAMRDQDVTDILKAASVGGEINIEKYLKSQKFGLETSVVTALLDALVQKYQKAKVSPTVIESLKAASKKCQAMSLRSRQEDSTYIQIAIVLSGFLTLLKREMLKERSTAKKLILVSLDQCIGTMSSYVENTGRLEATEQGRKIVNEIPLDENDKKILRGILADGIVKMIVKGTLPSMNKLRENLCDKGINTQHVIAARLVSEVIAGDEDLIGKDNLLAQMEDLQLLLTLPGTARQKADGLSQVLEEVKRANLCIDSRNSIETIEMTYQI